MINKNDTDRLKNVNKIRDEDEWVMRNHLPNLLAVFEATSLALLS